ncbi:MAG: glycoside hydrolase family 16 protein [Bacteroidales bacterium]|nr:glycoside hydrolase family 16 protein [Bacteroidales bacterium]
MRSIIFYFSMLLLTGILACKKSDPQPITPDATSWNLVWADEFESDTLNTGVWDISDTPKGITSRTGRSENLRIENGILIMELRQEEHSGMQYTGSEICTKGYKLYGKYECRAKLPGSDKAWPAFWMMGDWGEYGAWPDCGEVDIIEYWGHDHPNIYTNIHTQYSNWENNVDRNNHSTHFSLNDCQDEFHIYAMEWYTDHLNFLVDGVKYWTYIRLDDNWRK